MVDIKFAPLKDSVINRAIAIKLRQANALCRDEFRRYAEEYPDRTLAIQIIDAGENVGFGCVHGVLVMLNEMQTPTVTIRCSMRSFRAVLAGKMTPDDLFYAGFAKVEGRTVLRDKIILTSMFSTLKSVGLMK